MLFWLTDSDSYILHNVFIAVIIIIVVVVVEHSNSIVVTVLCCKPPGLGLNPTVTHVCVMFPFDMISAELKPLTHILVVL